MYRNARILCSLLVVVFLVLPDNADGWPFRRRRTSNHGSYSSSGGYTRIAPKVDPDSVDYRPLRVYYDYDKANGEDVAFADKFRVFLTLRDEEVLGTEGPIVAEAKITDVSDYQKTDVKYFPVSIESASDGDGKLGVFDVTNEGGSQPIIKPAKVYRLFVNLHRKSKQYGEESVLGRVPTPYYVATSGESRLERARQHIAMRTFKQFYYTEKGWRSEERPPIDCHAYYCWATGSCTVGAQNGRALLGRLFGGRFPYRNGSQISQLAGEGAIHADYVRQPGHTFMLLAYDPNLNHVWTMESNFNRTIEVAIRGVNSGWTVGHLEDEHITPGLFQAGAE